MSSIKLIESLGVYHLYHRAVDGALPKYVVYKGLVELPDSEIKGESQNMNRARNIMKENRARDEREQGDYYVECISADCFWEGLQSQTITISFPTPGAAYPELKHRCPICKAGTDYQQDRHETEES